MIKSNNLNQSLVSVAISSSPNIFENIFTGGENQEEGHQLTGIVYSTGGSGICAKNSFINFQNPSLPPILIRYASQGGVGPRLLGNTFTDCVAANIPQQDCYGVSSLEDETEMNNMVGNNVKRGNIRLCRTCMKTLPCLMCKECKSAYYCGEACQAQDWEEHQEFCTNYSQAKGQKTGAAPPK